MKKTDAKLTVGMRIRRRRDELGLTQVEAAKRVETKDRMGISQSRWANIEADRRAMTIKSLEKIAKALECEARDLI